jgi:hypothetical protein
MIPQLGGWAGYLTLLTPKKVHVIKYNFTIYILYREGLVRARIN